jgi:hypothetical protein
MMLPKFGTRKQKQQFLDTGTVDQLRQQLYAVDEQIAELRNQKGEIARAIDERLQAERAGMDPGQIVRMGQ